MTKTQQRLFSLYTWLGAVAVGWAALTSGCFDPKTPACAFSCTSATHACPTAYTCGDDGLCHRDDAPDAACGIAPVTDGGADAAD